MLEKYELAEQVGKGSFGIVHAAINRKTGERVAIKTMAKRFGPDGYLDQMFVRRVLHEVDILQHLGCSLNVAYCFGAFEESSCVGLVLEMCEGGELWSRIKADHSERDAARLVREILRTVAQCHSRNVIIRDVKPDNFLFLSDDDQSGMRAIDFGLAEYCEPGQYLSDKAGTVIYIAPEVLRSNYTLSADVWSVGIIAYLLLTGRLPFGGEDGQEVSDLFLTKQTFSNRDVFRAVLYSPLDFDSPPWDRLSGDAKDLVHSLLQRDADMRPTALEALHHPWLQGGTSASDAPIDRSIVQRLQRFGTYGRLKQVALRKVAHSFTEDSHMLSELRALFDAIDTDNSGTISHAEMLQAMKSGQWNLSDSEVSQLLAQLEVTPEGDFDYGDWIAALVDWKSLQESSEWDSWIKAAFDAFDVDGSGRLDTGKLNQVLCGDVCEVEDTVEAALREADIDHDGSISLKDFETLMRTPSAEALELFQTGWQQDLENEL
mmetsp:Transcript_18592/g.56153  ORF Transcript_18592/g.56153 Transcript_18592/m.56153 type:complete len:489 (-) Transcript_18592:1324-2790(-)